MKVVLEEIFLEAHEGFHDGHELFRTEDGTHAPEGPPCPLCVGQGDVAAALAAGDVVRTLAFQAELVILVHALDELVVLALLLVVRVGERLDRHDDGVHVTPAQVRQRCGSGARAFA